MDPQAYQKFSSLFLEGASCTTPQGVFKTFKEIEGFRAMAFEKVEKRKHTVREIFVGEERGAGLENGEGSVFIRGRVDFWLVEQKEPLTSERTRVGRERRQSGNEETRRRGDADPFPLCRRRMKDGTYSEDNAWSGRIVFGKNAQGEIKFAEYQGEPLVASSLGSEGESADREGWA